MPDTGLFVLIDVVGSEDDFSSHRSRLTSVQAVCLTCRAHVNARARPELEILRGASILYCCQCGARQAITCARLDEFRARVRAFPELEGAGQ